jgi:hypothetical protein
MRLQIDQTPRPRDRRVLGRRLVEIQAQEAAQRQRICRPPRDSALRVDPLEVADQQQAKIRAGRQTRSTDLVRVERRALRFDELVERVRVEHLIQALIERVPAAAR